ncbi:hypothetical protein CcBV_32.7 [Bracoviriform congregatae]|uniref:Uncharacterized protein n=1 Tax=Bracoviriform congregatae TaxID=39640 RepID=Q5ZNU2_9VIRU|nr:hypothetical protein CcBV_32.7 [Bracoviriform congregatae]CAG18437.1 hypothetical protein CcBV_32.7 [Bracoviriform congregatae]
MDQSRNNPQDKAVKGSGQKTPEKYTPFYHLLTLLKRSLSTSLSHRYLTLKAFLEADTRKLEGMRQCSKSSVPVHHNVNNQGCVTSTTTSDEKDIIKR